MEGENPISRMFFASAGAMVRQSGHLVVLADGDGKAPLLPESSMAMRLPGQHGVYEFPEISLRTFGDQCVVLCPRRAGCGNLNVVISR